MRCRSWILRGLFCLLFWGLLSVSLGWNLLGVAPGEWFANFQHDTEAHVMGRMVIARSHGLRSYGGLTGVGCQRAPKPVMYRAWTGGREARAQYAAFFNDTEFPDFDPYLSQPGWQALLFTLGDRALRCSNATKLEIFRGVTAVLTAAALVVVLWWVLAEVWWLAAFLAGISLVASEWLCVFGRNLWWSTWSFYLPMLGVMLLLRRRPVSRCKHWVLGVTVMGTLFVKCMMTGYEYITTTVVTLGVPLLFCQIRAWPGLKRGLLQWAVVGVGTLLAVALSMTILCMQIGAVRGGFADGVDHIRLSYFKRTYGDPDAEPTHLSRRTASVPTAKVLENYHRGIFFATGERDRRGRPLPEAVGWVVRYRDLLRLFGIATLLGGVMLCLPRRLVDKRRLVSVIAATWAAMLAPYSWFVIFKGHSIIHTHMNFILWQMPFTIFGFALIGLVLTQLATCLLRALPKRPT